MFNPQCSIKKRPCLYRAIFGHDHSLDIISVHRELKIYKRGCLIIAIIMPPDKKLC